MQVESDEKQLRRKYFLKNRAGKISPCVIQFIFQKENKLFWNNLELKRSSNPYWFNLPAEKKIGDRLEIVTYDSDGDVFRVTTTELEAVTKAGFCFGLIDRYDREDQLQYEKCPTCGHSTRVR